MTELVSYQFEDGVATLTLCNGKVNALSPAVFEALNAALDRAEQDRAIVILTGQPGILSGGYDLKVMTSSPQNAMALVATGSTFSRRMLAHPFPDHRRSPGARHREGRFPALVVGLPHRGRGPFPYRPQRGADRHDHAPRWYRVGT